jgi:predicted dienelactone hydrolase
VPLVKTASLPLVCLALIATACSGDDGDADGTTTTDPPATAVATQPATTIAATTTTAPPITTTPATTAPITAPTTAAPPTTPAPDAWEPVAPGAFEVGVATITLDDPAGERPLTVDVWFPIDPGIDTATLAPQQYTLIPGTYYESPGAFAADSAAIATGPFPLIVYSHGSSGLRYIHSAYTEALASNGYVVAAPDHTGNTAVDLLAGTTAEPPQIAFDRPTDARRVIDAMVDPAHPTAGPYAAQLDPERVAVTGHSLGGFTSIAMATGFANEVGEIAPDDRVDAIIPLAPAVSEELLPDERLASLDVPMLVVVGADDVTTPVDPNVTRLWDRSMSTPGYRVELVAGEHQTFTDVCAYQRTLPTLDAVPQLVIDTIDDFAEQGCSEGDIDDVRANEITVTYALAFLAEVFDGGPAITTAPDDAVLITR